MVYVVKIEVDEENGQDLGKLEQIAYEQDLVVDFDVLQTYED